MWLLSPDSRYPFGRPFEDPFCFLWVAFWLSFCFLFWMRPTTGLTTVHLAQGHPGVHFVIRCTQPRIMIKIVSLKPFVSE